MSIRDMHTDFAVMTVPIYLLFTSPIDDLVIPGLFHY